MNILLCHFAALLNCLHIQTKKLPIPGFYPPKGEKINHSEFTGVYKNKEFNIEYELVILHKQLVAIHSINKEIVLNPIAPNSFYSDKAFFGKT